VAKEGEFKGQQGKEDMVWSDRLCYVRPWGCWTHQYTHSP